MFGGAYIRRALSTEGNLRFKIDWASLIARSKLTVFALFYFVFEGNFSKYKPPVGLYLERLIHGGAYFRNFTAFSNNSNKYIDVKESTKTSSS